MTGHKIDVVSLWYRRRMVVWAFYGLICLIRLGKLPQVRV